MPLRHRIRLMALLFQTLITRYLGYKLRLRAFYYRKASELRLIIFSLGLAVRRSIYRVTQRIGQIMTYWCCVARNIEAAYSSTSVRYSSTAKECKAVRFLARLKRKAGSKLSRWLGK